MKLSAAVRDGNVEAVKQLLDELGHEEAIAEFRESNILFTAVEAREFNGEILELLVNKLGDSAKDAIRANKDEDGWTPVHHAVDRKNVEAVEILLMALKEQVKDFVFEKDDARRGDSILHYAAKWSNVEVVKALLDHVGSCKEEQMEAIKAMKNMDGQTLLHAAAERGEEKVFDLLADTVGLVDPVSRADLYKLEDTHGNSVPLAAFSGSFNIFKRVCEELGDDAVTLHALQNMFESGWIRYSMKTALGEGNEWLLEKVCRLLDDLGPDKTQDLIFTFKTQDLVHIAAWLEKEEFLTILLARLGKLAGYAILQKDIFGKTALHHAAQSGTVQALKLLMDTIHLHSAKDVILHTDDRGYTLLHCAAMNKSSHCIGVLEFIVERLGSDETVQAAIQLKSLEDLRSALHVAAKADNPTGAEYLLNKLGPHQAKQAICETDKRGSNVLRVAASSGSVETFKVLMVALGPELFEQVMGEGEYYALYHRFELVKIVMRALGSKKFGDLLSKQNKHGQTPFDRIAITSPEVFKEIAKCVGSEMMKSLILRRTENGSMFLHRGCLSADMLVTIVETLGEEATINCFHIPDGKGNTVLHHALQGFHYPINILQKVGAEQLRSLLKQRNNTNETPLHRLLSEHMHLQHVVEVHPGLSVEDMKSILGGRGGHEHRALHVACELGSKYVVKLLLDHGFKDDIMRQDVLFLGNTALHAAAIKQWNVRNSKIEIFKLLVDALGPEEVEIDCTNWYGQTPLHFAIMSNDHALVKYVLDKGANLHTHDHAETTVWHFASRMRMRSSRTVWELLLDSCASEGEHSDMFNKVTEAGLTPLHYAAWHRNVDSIPKELLGQENLKATDQVEHLSSLAWAAAAMRRSNIDVDDDLIDAYMTRKVNPFPEKEDLLFPMDGTFVIPPANRVMETTCQRMIEEDFPLTRMLVACTLVYGNTQTNEQMAKLLLISSNQLDTSRAKAKVLADSRALELVARGFSLDSSRKESLDAFLKGICGHAEEEIIPMLKEQFETAFTIALENKADVGFLQVLITYMPQKFRVRELLQVWLCKINNAEDGESLKRKYESLSAAERSKIKDVVQLIEDVPLAYWMACIQIQPIKKNQDEVSLVRTLLTESAVVDNGYPNTVGRHTGRTALHWAVIFSEMDVVSELTRDGSHEKCKKDVLDDFGKPAYWYALLHKDKLQVELDKQAYMSFVNHLKWERYYDSLYKDRDLYVDGLNAILVGAALIATVAFTGLVTPPLQYPMAAQPSSNNTTAVEDLKYIAIQLPEVQVFWVSIGMSFFLSMTSALACVTGILPDASSFDLLEVERIRKLVVAAATFLVLSIAFVLVAFASGGFAVLPNKIKLRSSMIITVVLGGALCIYRLWRFGRAIYSLTPNNRLRGAIQWIKSYTRAMAEWSGESVVVERTGSIEKDKPERRSYKRGSIHESIVRAGGFSGGPYEWDDGLWDAPFAIKQRPASSPSTEDVPDLEESTPPRSVPGVSRSSLEISIM